MNGFWIYLGGRADGLSQGVSKERGVKSELGQLWAGAGTQMGRAVGPRWWWWQEIHLDVFSLTWW